jgi:cation transport ATPase
VVVIGLIIMASTPVVQRITTLTQGELEDELEGRRNIWAGILFIPVMLWIVYWFFRTGFTRLKSRSRQTQGITLGAMAALVALLIHSYSDGNLQIPANALLFTALAAAGLRKV